MSSGRRRTGEGDVDARLDSVEEFLESLDELLDVQLLEIHATWRRTDPRARERAWTAAAAAAARSGLTERLGQVREAATQWATRSPTGPWLYSFNDMGRADMRRQAAPALADAAVALLLGDHLDEKSGDVLIAPWLRSTRSGV